jgi:sugar phosphate isomerase/epimerase
MSTIAEKVSGSRGGQRGLIVLGNPVLAIPVRCRSVLGILVPLVWGVAVWGLSGGGMESVSAAEQVAPYSLFVFDNGVRGIADPPKLLKELGYAGVAWGGWNVAPVVKQYEAHGLKVFSTYVSCHLDKNPPYDPSAKEAIAQLRGTDVIIWLCVLGGKCGQEDEKAVRIIREIADLAASAGLRVALYPHTGFYVATTADALRLVRQIDRKNVGVTINLCHELMTDQGPKLSTTIRQAMPHLFLVSINGADAKEPGFGWDRLIQPLGRGNFDVYGFLKELHAAGYRGPIGLQCYGLKGDPVENLRQSIEAWREYMDRLATGK